MKDLEISFLTFSFFLVYIRVWTEGLAHARQESHLVSYMPSPSTLKSLKAWTQICFNGEKWLWYIFCLWAHLWWEKEMSQANQHGHISGKSGTSLEEPQVGPSRRIQRKPCHLGKWQLHTCYYPWLHDVQVKIGILLLLILCRPMFSFLKCSYEHFWFCYVVRIPSWGRQKHFYPVLTRS